MSRFVHYVCSNGEKGKLPYEDVFFSLVKLYKVDANQMLQLTSHYPVLQKDILDHNSL